MGIFSEFLNQPLIDKYYDLKVYGIIFASATIIQTVLLFFFNKIINFVQKFNTYMILVLAWSFGILLMLNSISNVYFLIPIMGVLWFMGTLLYITIENELNQRIKDDSKRATILSTNSMFASLMIIIALPIFGFLSDIYVLEIVVIILSVFSLITGIVLLFAKHYFVD